MTALPDGWRRMALGDVAETALGKMLDRAKDRGLPRVRYLRNVNVQWGRIDTDDVLEMELADDERERFGVEAGDLLVCEGGEIGRAAIWTGSAEYMAYQKALHRVRPHEVLDSRFMLHQFAFLAQTNSFDGLATGSTIRHLPQQQLRRVPVVVPPLAEQRRIVDILEGHLSHLDAANDYLDATLRRIELLRRAWLREALPSAIPTDEAYTISEAITDSRGGWSRSRKHIVDGDLGVPYLKMNNISPSGALDLDEVVRVEATAQDVTRYGLEIGDILFNSKNSGELVGKTAVADSRVHGWVLNENIMRLRFDGRLDPRFVGLWFLGPAMRSHIMEAASASTNVAAVYMHTLKDFPLWIPSKTIQERLVSEHDELQRGNQELLGSIIANGRRSRRLRTALLSAAFSGHLTGHASEMERVEELAVS